MRYGLWMNVAVFFVCAAGSAWATLPGTTLVVDSAPLADADAAEGASGARGVSIRAVSHAADLVDVVYRYACSTDTDETVASLEVFANTPGDESVADFWVPVPELDRLPAYSGYCVETLNVVYLDGTDYPRTDVILQVWALGDDGVPEPITHDELLSRQAAELRERGREDTDGGGAAAPLFAPLHLAPTGPIDGLGRPDVPRNEFSNGLGRDSADESNVQ